MRRHIGLGLAQRELPAMEDGGGQHGIGTPIDGPVNKILQRPHAPTRHHGDPHRIDDGPDQRSRW